MYKVELIHKFWTCGDGCCDESWWYGEITNTDAGVVEFDCDDGDDTMRKSEALEHCTNWLDSKGITEYTTEEWDDYSCYDDIDY